MKPQAEHHAKKNYHSPRLLIYGDIRLITNASNMAGNAGDSGNPGMDKT